MDRLGGLGRNLSKLFENFSKNFGFWLGALPPRPAKPYQTPRLKGCSSHLIEAAKLGGLDQMIFFSVLLTTRAPLTTVQPDDRPDVQLDVWPDAWPDVRPNQSAQYNLLDPVINLKI